MNDFSEYLILAGGLFTIYTGMHSRKNLDILIGVCFVFLAVLTLSRQTGKIVEATDIVISILIVIMATLKLRATMRKNVEKN